MYPSPSFIGPPLKVVAFRIYNVSADGLLKPAEVFAILKAMVGNHLTDDELQTIVDKTVGKVGQKGHGCIGFDEFERVTRLDLLHV